MVYSIWKVHRNCWPLCRRCFLWLHIIYSFHVNLWVSGICNMYHVDRAKLICRLGTYELKVVSKSHSNFLYPKHGCSIKASPGPPQLARPPRPGPCLDFGFQYTLIRNNCSNSPWRPCSLKHAPNIFDQKWLRVNLRYFGSTYFQTWLKQFYEHNNIWTFNMWYK